jgi:hypothetical protein
MQNTADFDRAFAELEGAAFRLADALDNVRAAAEPAAGIDLTLAIPNLEQQADDYVAASGRVGTAIAAAAGEQFDVDAVARMSASIGLDLKVAERLAVHARLEPQVDSDDAGGAAPAYALRAVGAEDSAAFGETPSLASVLSPVLHEIHGAADPATRLLFATSVAPGAAVGVTGTPASVAAAIDKILAAGGTAIAASLSAVAVPDQAGIVTLIDNLSGTQAGDAAQGAIDQVSRFLHPLARAAGKVLALVIDKIKAIVGSDQLDALLGDAKKWLIDKWNDLTQRNPAGFLLGLLLDQADVEQTCAEKLKTMDPAGASATVQACDDVASAHEKCSRYLGWANSALDFAAKTVIGKTPQGLLLLSLVALALVGCSIWLAQDYIDAERFGFLPNRVLGIRGTVVAA